MMEFSEKTQDRLTKLASLVVKSDKRNKNMCERIDIKIFGLGGVEKLLDARIAKLESRLDSLLADQDKESKS